MSKARDTAKLLSMLSVYRGIRNNNVIGAFYKLLCSLDEEQTVFLENWGHFFDLLTNEGYSTDLALCLTSAALYDENSFSKAAAAGKSDNINSFEKTAIKNDIHTMILASELTAQDIVNDYKYKEELGSLAYSLPTWGIGKPVSEFSDEDNAFERLSEFYRKNGFGIYAGYKAFIWRSGCIVPVTYPDTVSVDDLIGYSFQRDEVIKNTEAFLKGVPGNNVLLYGDRGTGKSSTIKAILNKYSKDGLRMVEMPKEDLCDFPLLVEQIAGIPLKFIIFIDDLSFNNDDSSYARLKAVLEGGLAARPDNTLIYATSNRRHLIKESFSDREGDDMHINDTVQETLSLFDRFGLAVNFSKPDKDTYLEIVTGLADKNIKSYDKEKLIRDAERWAIARGGRSPRCAKQFISNIMSEM